MRGLTEQMHRRASLISNRWGVTQVAPSQTRLFSPALQRLAQDDPSGSDDGHAVTRSLRNVEDLPVERVIDLCHETVPLWWNRFGPMFAGDVQRQRVKQCASTRILQGTEFQPIGHATGSRYQARPPYSLPQVLDN